MGEMHVSREKQMDAPPQAVYALLSDFHRWTEWSPWEDVDPELQRDYSGAPRGTGAKYHWSGNRKAGEGHMAITDAVDRERVVVDLAFLKPFKAQNVTTFTLTPREGGTHVEWSMRGPKNLVMSVLSPVMRIEQSVGKDFEKGLEQLERAARGAT